MEQYNSPNAEFVEFDAGDIITTSGQWGTQCTYQDAGNNSISDDDCDLYQQTDNTYESP